MNIELASSFERGASNEKFKKHSGTLIYNTWKDGMNPIK
ncbi:epimerase [Staphylococcus epidermidis]|nr:epimerase [Staphylococcus epidermidis]